MGEFNTDRILCVYLPPMQFPIESYTFFIQRGNSLSAAIKINVQIPSCYFRIN